MKRETKKLLDQELRTQRLLLAACVIVPFGAFALLVASYIPVSSELIEVRVIKTGATQTEEGSKPFLVGELPSGTRIRANYLMTEVVLPGALVQLTKQRTLIGATRYQFLGLIDQQRGE